MRRASKKMLALPPVPSTEAPPDGGRFDPLEFRALNVGMHYLRLLSMTLALAACGSDDDAGDTASDTSVADTPDAPDAASCNDCAAPKLCCPSRFDGDIARCIDPDLNPENCGRCGTQCGGACLDGACIEAPACGGGETCPDPLACSGGPGMGRCCPDGTTFIMSPADFFGCCPDGDICGCREGNCPISRREAKQQIRWIDDAERARLTEALLATPLATYRYVGATSERRQLGFVIGEGSPDEAVTADGGHVDLYGYVSLAVAALQTQRREIDDLRAELAALKARLEAPPR